MTCSKSFRFAICLAAGLAVRVSTLAQQQEPDTALTIYSTAQPGAISPELYRPTGIGGYNPWQNTPSIPGYAVVKQIRELDLKRGTSSVRFADVAASIDPTTVRFESLTDPEGTEVLEQSYQFDLVSQAKLMERFIDQTITVHQQRGDKEEAMTGVLVSAGGAWGGGVVLRLEDGKLVNINSYNTVTYPSLPEGLITRPTLVWDLSAKREAPHRCRVTYQTSGITWWADYNLVYREGANANSGVLDIGAWVSIVNQSGASYKDARLKLVAGDVHRAPQPSPDMLYMRREAAAVGGEMAPGFAEKSFFEYHLYTLGRTTSIPDNSTKQIELFPIVHEVEAEKVLVYYGLSDVSYGVFPDPVVDQNYGTQCNKKVDIYLRFKNDEKKSMGMPLPSGRIRVSKLDPDDGTLEFIGEDVIDHTPKDEMVLVKMGQAFDIVGDRRQTDYKMDLDKRWIEETVEVSVRNHKTEAVNVIVKENLFRWLNWEIKAKSHEFEKTDARTIHFPVRIEADGEAKVSYTVRYSW